MLIWPPLRGGEICRCSERKLGRVAGRWNRIQFTTRPTRFSEPFPATDVRVHSCRNMTLLEIPLELLKVREICWKNIASEVILAEQSKPKRVLGSRTKRICKFCDKTRPQAQFSSDAHVIPAAFGNRSLFSNEECDQCNRIGSRYEDDLAKFLALPRVLSRIRGRKKAPKLKDPRGQSYAQAMPDKQLVYLHQSNEEQSFQVSEKFGKLEIISKTPTYRSVNVARALGRMALFLLDREDRMFSPLHSWVVAGKECFPLPFEAVNIPGHGTREVGISLCKYLNFGNRELVIIRFRFFTFILSVAFPLDGTPLPTDLPLMNYAVPGMPNSVALALRQNTSRFLIKNADPELTGESKVTLDYTSKHELQSIDELLGGHGG